MHFYNENIILGITIMNDEQIKIQEQFSHEIPEDVLALSNTYSLTKLSYIDVVEQEQIAEILKQWVLFSELATLKK